MLGRRQVQSPLRTAVVDRFRKFKCSVDGIYNYPRRFKFNNDIDHNKMDIDRVISYVSLRELPNLLGPFIRLSCSSIYHLKSIRGKEKQDIIHWPIDDTTYEINGRSLLLLSNDPWNVWIPVHSDDFQQFKRELGHYLSRNAHVQPVNLDEDRKYVLLERNAPTVSTVVLCRVIEHIFRNHTSSPLLLYARV